MHAMLYVLVFICMVVCMCVSADMLSKVVFNLLSTNNLETLCACCCHGDRIVFYVSKEPWPILWSKVWFERGMGLLFWHCIVFLSLIVPICSVAHVWL